MGKSLTTDGLQQALDLAQALALLEQALALLEVSEQAFAPV
jgi:hypothetical protein